METLNEKKENGLLLSLEAVEVPHQYQEYKKLVDSMSTILCRSTRKKEKKRTKLKNLEDQRWRLIHLSERRLLKFVN